MVTLCYLDSQLDKCKNAIARQSISSDRLHWAFEVHIDGFHELSATDLAIICYR